MTMHLVRGLANTSTKKRKVTLTKRKQAELEHINFLRKKQGLDLLESMVAPKASKRKFTPMKPSDISKLPRVPRPGSDHSTIKSKGDGVGVAVKKDIPEYTGDKMIGIGQLHKSNAVPIFKKEDAEDLAKMRR